MALHEILYTSVLDSTQMETTKMSDKLDANPDTNLDTDNNIEHPYFYFLVTIIRDGKTPLKLTLKDRNKYTANHDKIKLLNAANDHQSRVVILTDINEETYLIDLNGLDQIKIKNLSKNS